MTTLNVIFSDVGEEIDDEVAIHHLTKTSENETWLIILVPGATNVDPNSAKDEVDKRLTRFSELFPHFEITQDETITGWRNKWSNDTNSTFYIGNIDMINSPYLLINELGRRATRTTTIESSCLQVKHLIQIAPLWHIHPNHFQRFKIDKYIVMGDIANPSNSINLTKAIPEYATNLHNEYNLQQKNILQNSNEVLPISTNMARNVPMPYRLMETMPIALSEPLLKTAFQQCVGRVPPHLPFARNISIVNHKTIINYCNIEQREDIICNQGINIIPEKVRLNIKEQVSLFLKNANQNEQEDEKYIRRLEDIAQAIYIVTGEEYLSPNKFTAFNAQNMFNADKAESTWRNHVEINNCNLTPCYDLLSIIVKDCGYVPTIDECNEIISSYA